MMTTVALDRVRALVEAYQRVSVDELPVADLEAVLDGLSDADFEQLITFKTPASADAARWSPALADAWDQGWTASEACDAAGASPCGDCPACNTPNPYRTSQKDS